MKMNPLKKGSTFEEAVQAMNALRHFHRYDSAQTSQKRAPWLAIKAFWIILAGFQDLLFPTIGHMT